MLRDDAIRLRHMLDAAREAIGFAPDRTRADLDTDRQLVLALVKAIEIVGEAASRVTPPTKQRLPEIPWDDIVGMRHRLIHAYAKLISGVRSDDFSRSGASEGGPGTDESVTTNQPADLLAVPRQVPGASHPRRHDASGTI